MSDPTPGEPAMVEGLDQPWLLRRPETGILTRDTTRELVDDREGTRRIECPLCAWKPQPASRWACSDCPQPEGLARGCGAVWNTFETSGICPGCRHAWEWTSCLSCGGWSRHEDWYRSDDDQPA